MKIRGLFVCSLPPPSFLVLSSWGRGGEEKKKDAERGRGSKFGQPAFFPLFTREVAASTLADLKFLFSVYEHPPASFSSLDLSIFHSQQTLSLKQDIVRTQAGSIHTLKLRHTLGRKVWLLCQSQGTVRLHTARG